MQDYWNKQQIEYSITRSGNLNQPSKTSSQEQRQIQTQAYFKSIMDPSKFVSNQEIKDIFLRFKNGSAAGAAKVEQLEGAAPPKLAKSAGMLLAKAEVVDEGKVL